MDRHLSSSPVISDGAPLTLPSADPRFDLDVAEAENEDMADRELDLTLQLLANRAQQLSRASAATIAVAEGHELVCRASAGPMAAGFGSELRANRALIEKSIETQQIVCCNDTGKMVRGDGIAYAVLGIKSMMVRPLIKGQHVVAMFELLADRTQAFQDRDGATLEYLSEMVLTALQRAYAAKHAREEIMTNLGREFGIAPESQSESQPCEGAEPLDRESPATQVIDAVGICQACGFPISEGRTFCLDCEESSHHQQSDSAAPAFLSQLAREESQSWFESHFYILGTLLMVLLTVVVLLLKFH
jgi:putative methionine-R-sulfoxide reductase with GAF domain